MLVIRVSPQVGDQGDALLFAQDIAQWLCQIKPLRLIILCTHCLLDHFRCGLGDIGRGQVAALGGRHAQPSQQRKASMQPCQQACADVVHGEGRIE